MAAIPDQLFVCTWPCPLREQGGLTRSGVLSYPEYADSVSVRALYSLVPSSISFPLGAIVDDIVVNGAWLYQVWLMYSSHYVRPQHIGIVRDPHCVATQCLVPSSQGTSLVTLVTLVP